MVLAVHHLVGSAEIGRMLGVSRQRVQQLINSEGFPEPEVVLDMGKVWKRADVEAWDEKRKTRLPRHSAPSQPASGDLPKRVTGTLPVSDRGLTGLTTPATRD